ncbi:imidazolonepropionase [Devosia sp.]|uniref:imidazolonepropionase n=1 Tax=Devosia sp. TaxID=1871048 RepID=UPI001AD253A0|nr:imidazolonepropionase [Devosia sp.]MBN9310620.1 imidazolonepropionase [Devosia sp.]
MTAAVLYNCNVATMVAGSAYGLITDAAIAMDGGKIAWVGTAVALPAEHAAIVRHDLGGALVTPGLIDCHTHLVFGGNRADEFEWRLNGLSYAEIARRGGGILSSVRATRDSDVESLTETTLKRLDHLIAEGVTTVEIKSGYGLTIAAELKMLRVARRLGELRPVTVRTTYLAAHAVPPEFAGEPDRYIDTVVLPGLAEAHAEGLVDAIDGFCESIAFSPGQIARVFEAAQALGLPVKLHAEQLSNLGGAALAARHGALSADHLEYLDAAGIVAMAASGTVAVLLPGAFYALRETQAPPVTALRTAGVPIALATDSNPGTSPLTSLLLVLNMGCVLFGLTPEEALAGVTRNAARALGLQSNLGTIAVGNRADLAVWDVRQPAELSYRIGFNPLVRRVYGGMW